MIYLDYAATTPLDPEVRDAMEFYMRHSYGNASSVHTYGRDTRMAIERARQEIANVLGAHPQEIIFTSSASESNNLAIKGVVESVRTDFQDNEPYEVVSSPVEHPCVIESLRHLEKLGWIKIVWLPVDRFGMVQAEDVARFISPRTILVSVMYVNNEIGTCNPICEIGQVVMQARSERVAVFDTHSTYRSVLPLYFHTDAVQAVQFYDCHVDRLGVDLMTLSAHKVYGPQGVGILYVRKGVRLTRQLDGGGQEYYYRAGTENAIGIVGAGLAFSMVERYRDSLYARLTSLQKYLFEHIVQAGSGIHVTGSIDSRSPHICSFFIEHTDAEALIIALDRVGFAVSSGSACSSGIVKLSHVISALGLVDVDIRRGAPLRVSLGHDTTHDSLQAFLQAFRTCLMQVRQLS